MNVGCQRPLIEVREARSARPANAHAGNRPVHSLRMYFASFAAGIHRLQLRRSTVGRVLNTRDLITLGDRYLDAARQSGRPLSLAVFEFEHLQEVRGIFGSRISGALLARVRAKLAAAAGSQGVIAHTGSVQFTLLFPGADLQTALDAIHRQMGTPARIELESARDEIVLVPEFQVECANDDGESILDLYRRLRAELQEILRLQRRRVAYLTLERERYSRPQPLCAELRAATGPRPRARGTR